MAPLDFIATSFVNDPVLSPKTKFWDAHDYNTPCMWTCVCLPKKKNNS